MDLVLYIFTLFIVSGLSVTVTAACALSGRKAAEEEIKNLRAYIVKLENQNNDLQYGDPIIRSNLLEWWS